MIENSTNPSGGEHIIIGGLFVQIIFFGFFFIMSLLVVIRTLVLLSLPRILIRSNNIIIHPFIKLLDDMISIHPNS